MISFDTHIRVRYSETDQMGYCYYGNYAQYYEVGRAELIRSLGLSYQKMESEYGILMPVMTLNIRYVRPALYDELLKVSTTLRKMPHETMTFYTEIFNEKNELLNGGHVKLGFIQAKDKKSTIAPNYLIDQLKPYFEISER